MTERQAHLAFNLTNKVGAVKLDRMVEEYGSAVAAWEHYPNREARSGGEIDWEEEERKAEKFGVRILTRLDEEYPARLRDSPSAPLALYVKGEVKALSAAGIAMIGTRRATRYGQETANKLAYELVKSGWSVISGLALGIDAASHQGALDAGGVTVGVIGSGLDRFYPEENRELAHEIVKNGGAVVSQFPFGRPADVTTFPIRNHVVAALAQGVVAVECPMKSGTLITTSIAADLGRVVMAVPGRITDRMSLGSNHLIREGATMVCSIDDINEAMGRKIEVKEATVEKDGERPKFTAEESMLLMHIDEGGISVDELVGLTGMAVSKVNALVMELRIKGFVRFLPGNRVASLRG